MFGTLLNCLFYFAGINLSWESAPLTLNSREDVVVDVPKKHCNFRLLSIDMKTKIVQHVLRIIFNFSNFLNFQVFYFFSFCVSFLVGTMSTRSPDLRFNRVKVETLIH